MRNNVLNVIVCGSTFGSYYVEAINRNSKDFKISGIFAKGSVRSKNLADKYNIPLYTNLEDLPDDIDLACVILRSEGVGGEGTEICHKLLNKKINVIQEQPVYYNHQRTCLELAIDNRVVYMTANIFSHFENIRSFIEYSKAIKKLSKLLYINASFSVQVSYTAIDILIMAGAYGKLDIKKVECDSCTQPFDILCGKLGDIPINIEYNNRFNPEYPDYNMHLMHKIDFYFTDGVLSLNDTYGCVSWRPRSYVKFNNYNKYLKDELAYINLFEGYSLSINDIYSQIWIEAITKEILEAKNYILNARMNSSRVNRELIVSKNWKTLQDAAGYAKITDENIKTFKQFCDIHSLYNNERR